jgi:hypothetical protein
MRTPPRSMTVVLARMASRKAALGSIRSGTTVSRCGSPSRRRRIVSVTFCPPLSANDSTGLKAAPSAASSSSPTSRPALSAGSPLSTPLTNVRPSMLRVKIPIPV